MSVKYSLVFLLLGLVNALMAVVAWGGSGAVALVFGYVALSFWLAGAAYAGLGPRVFLKRADGRFRPLTWLLHSPYLLFNAFAFWMYRLGSRQPAYAMAAANLSFGRRLTAGEWRRAEPGWQSILDLAPEFPEVAGLRAASRYRSLPILDGTAPTSEQLREAVAWIAESVALGPTFVHCALGHGRTATIVVAYLLTIGNVATIREGLARLRSQRPGVGLNRQQADGLRTWERARKEPVAEAGTAYEISIEEARRANGTPPA